MFVNHDNQAPRTVGKKKNVSYIPNGSITTESAVSMVQVWR